MAVTLVFLGRLEDVAGTQQLTVPPGAIDAILDALGPPLAEALRHDRIRVAINGALVSEREQQLMVADGDEVAFLPPVSGG